MDDLLPGTTYAVDPASAFPVAGDAGVALGVGAGQHGLAPIIGNGGGSMTNAVTDVWQWLNTPFKHPMSAVGVFALVGSAIVAIMLWNLILYHIRIAAETI
jgi:hypothetical protein